MDAGTGGVTQHEGWTSVCTTLTRQQWSSGEVVAWGSVSVCNSSDLVPASIALEAENPNMDHITTIGVLLTPTEARQLAAALVALADEIEGQQ